MIRGTEFYKLQKDVLALEGKELPIASTTVLGGVKVGTNLRVDADGKLHAVPQDVDLSPFATKVELATKVDKVAGKDLVSTGDITQITTNKTDITNLKSGKVDKVTGKELIATTDIAQINTNKTNITALTGSKVDKVTGKELVSTTDIAQITTNKTDIATLKTGKVDVADGMGLISTANVTQITTNKNNIATLTSGKVDKVAGKDLVTAADITQITTNKTNITSLQSGKVDKVSGKELSSNDFTTAHKTKLDGINMANHYTKAEIDTKLDAISQCSMAMLTMTENVAAGSWTKNATTGYFETTVTHGFNTRPQDLDVKFFSGEQNVSFAYDIVDNNSIIVYSDEATVIKVHCRSIEDTAVRDSGERKIQPYVSSEVEDLKCRLNNVEDKYARLVNKLASVLPKGCLDEFMK